MDAILFTGAGLVIPPIVASMIMKQMPVAWATSKPAFYAVKAASVLIPSYLVKRFVSPRAGNLMLLGGAASFMIDILNETGVLTSIKSAFGLSGAISQPMLGYYPGIGGGLGKYPSLSANGSAPVTAQRMVSSVPSRLNPADRF